MKKSLFFCFYCIISCYTSVAISEENTNAGYESSMIIMQQKINKLTKELYATQNRVELLEEKLKIAEKKITEAFKAIEFKSFDKINKIKIEEKSKEEEEAYLLYSNARNNLKLNFYDEAINLFSQYIEKYKNGKNYADANYWLAVSFYQKGSYEKAEELFIKFQQEYPLHSKYPNSLYNLSQTLIKLSKIKEAKKILNKILDKFPENPLSIKASNEIKELK